MQKKELGPISEVTLELNGEKSHYQSFIMASLFKISKKYQQTNSSL